MNFIFSVFPILFSLVFMLVFGTIIYNLVRGIEQEYKNNHSPRLTVEAKVLSKRSDYHRHYGGNHFRQGHTNYYVTFEVQSGDRIELQMQGNEYGLLVEGDFGDLTFQGKRYLAFQRKVNDDL